MSRLDIVCPYVERDKERFEILWMSIEKFLKISDYRLFLVSASGSKPIKSSKIIPIKEIDLDKNLADKKFDKYGWWKQQIIKLQSFKFCETECILSVDCDCFLTKNLYYKNITYKNKPVLSLDKEGSWDNWYNGSKAILKLPFNFINNRIGVTPILFSGSILRSLDRYLEVLYGSNKTAFLLSNTNDRYYPSKIYKDSSETWSEYCLYHIYAEYTGLIDKYHSLNKRIVMSSNNFWNEDQANVWDPKKSFIKSGGLFTVAQSVANKPAAWVLEKIKDYIS